MEPVHTMQTIQKTILLVEDEVIQAMLEKTALEKYGYSVLTAISGEKAVTAVETRPEIDLILMDIDLGKGIDGTEAAELILARHNIPVVFLSSHTEPEIVAKTEKITSYGYVVKNSSITVLDASVKMAFKLFYANKKTEESEERFQMLFNNAPLGYQSLDIDGNFLEVNQQWLDTLGYTKEEVIHAWFGDFLSPEYKDGFRKRFPIFKEQGFIHSEFEMMHKNGKKLFIAFEGKIGHESNGDFKQTHCILQDITERKKEEFLLKLTQERHTFALEGSELGEWDWHLKTGEITRNERWAKTLGYTLSEITGTIQQGIDLQHPDDRERSWNAIQDHFAGRTESFNITYRMLAKDGNFIWIHDCGKVMERDVQGNPVRVCGTHGNIDEQVKSKELLLKSNALLTSIIESSADIIVFALDTEYNYLSFNSKHAEGIRQIWGKHIEIGMNMLEVIGDHADRIIAKANFDRALSGENFVLCEEYGKESLSRISWVNYWSPIRDIHHTITGLTCFVLNNTEQKSAEQKIKNLLDEKELLLREVHHRIKNNMTTISGLLILQAGSVSDRSTNASLIDASNRVKSMQILYDKLYRSTDFNQLSLASYLDPLTDEILSNFQDTNLFRVTKNFDDNIIGVNILQPLGIIINELLTNAIKYAFVGRASGLITVSATVKDNLINLTIADNGNGIPPTVDFEHSTGFGFVLVHGLTQQLGGNIKIIRGEGTKIVLEFAL